MLVIFAGALLAGCTGSDSATGPDGGLDATPTAIEIEYGIDQCPLIRLTELGSAFPELVEPRESLAQGSSRFACTFGVPNDATYTARLVGGSTGNGPVITWDSWLAGPRSTEVVNEIDAGDVPARRVRTVGGGTEVAFRGTDDVAWLIDVAHPDEDRAFEIELTIARLLGSS